MDRNSGCPLNVPGSESRKNPRYVRVLCPSSRDTARAVWQENVRPLAAVAVAGILSSAFATAVLGCGGGGDSSSTSASNVTGTTGPSGPTGPNGTAFADQLRQYVQDHPLTLPKLEVDQACATAHDAADLYDRLHIGSTLDDLVEHLSAGNLETHAFEVLGLIGVVGTSSPEACTQFENGLESQLKDGIKNLAQQLPP
jgi:hypothetical protein